MKTSGLSQVIFQIILVVIVLALVGPGLYADPPAVDQLPTGGQVVSGQGNIVESGTRMTVNQNTPSMIADWQTFNIGKDASVNFVQPSAEAAALNRVRSADPSQIYGNLTANGRVFLINPSGVTFGPSARIDAAGLAASSLNMSNEDFNAGRYRFSGGNGGSVVNAGEISAREGGFVALVGASVDNTGVIRANGGQAALAAGEGVTMDLTPNGLVSVKVDTAGHHARVQNSGKIVADGGRVWMTAKNASPALAGAVNQSGVVRANTLAMKNGEIWLDGGNGEVSMVGTTEARGNEPGQSGGVIVATGDRVTVPLNARVDASGKGDGGKVHLGGGWQGRDPAIPEPRRVVMEKGAVVKADAEDAGSGGTVVLWSNEATRHDGMISARGAGTGRGGQVETSSRGVLGVAGRVDVATPGGDGGTWLLDPYNLTVSTAASSNVDGTGFAANGDSAVVQASTIEAAINAGTNVTLSTSAGGAQSGDITISADISKTAGGAAKITFAADNDITLSSGADISSTVGALSLDFGTVSTTTGTITLSGTLATNGGAVNFYKPTILGHATPVSTKITELSIAASGNMTFYQNVSLAAPGYAVTLSSAGPESGGSYTGNGGAIDFQKNIASSTPINPAVLWSQALTVDTSGNTPGSITLGTAAGNHSIGGAAANTQLKSLTLTGPTSVTLNSSTINLMDVSGNVLVASSTLGTPAIKMNATDTTINVTGGTRAGVSGYADYKQETFDLKTPDGTARTLTINADRSIKIKNRSIDSTVAGGGGGGSLAVNLNPFVATAGAVGGGIYLNSATIQNSGGDIKLGQSQAYATGYGSDEDGVTDGIYLLNGKLISTTGNIYLYGKAPLTSNAGSGIRLSGAQTDLNSGTGNLSLDGRVTVATNAGNKDGLIVGEGGSSRVTLQASGAGTITLNGDSSSVGVNPTGGSRYDGVIISSAALIKTATGDITITGKGGGGDKTFVSENHGIRIEDTYTVIASTSGNISLTGTSGGKTSFTTGSNSYGILAKGQTMYLGTAHYSAINAGDTNSGISASGILTLTADLMEFENSSSLHMKVASSGELRVLPETASRDIQFHGDPSSPDLNEDSSIVGKLYLGSNWFNGGSLSVFQAGFGNTGYGTAGTGATGAVTIGRTDGSGTMTVADTTTFRDNTTLLMGATTGNIKVNAPVTVQGSSAPTARILTMDTAAGGAGASAMTADQLLLLGTGNYVFSGSNLVGTLSASLTGATTGHLTFNNAQALTIGTITSEGLNTARTATGITANSNTASNQVTVGTTSGALTIAQSINTGNKGVAALYATHTISGGVVETGAATITAGSLYVGSGGVLSQLRNDNVIKQAASDGILAVNATKGLEFKNGAAGGGIQTGRVSYSARSADTSGTVTTTAVNKDGFVTAGAGSLWLPSGHLTQDITANGFVRQGDVQALTLSLKVDSGSVTLDNTTNQIGTLAASLAGVGQTLSVMDLDGLTVGSITSAVTGANTTVSGITTNIGDVILKASAHATSTAGDVVMTHSIDTTNGGAMGSGAIARLASGKGAITESSSAIVKAKSLLLDGVSTSSLDNLNEIYDSTVGTTTGTLAASISGSGQGLKFRNARSTDIGTVTASHGVGATSGITAITGDVILTLVDAATTNHLTQTQLVKAGKLKTDVDTGKVALNLISFGNTNEIGTVSSVMGGAGQDYTLNEKDGLSIGTVDGTSGITTASNGRIAIATQNGGIIVTRDVTAGGMGTVDFRANGTASDIAITPASGQTATVSSGHGGTIQFYAGRSLTTNTANGSGTELRTTGDILLQTGSGMGSDANRIEIANAAKLAGIAGDSIFLRKLGITSDLEIGSVRALDFNGLMTFVAGPSNLNGLTTTANNGNITLTTQGGDLTITQGVTAHGSGYVDIRTANTGNLGDIAINNGATISSTSGTIQVIAGNTVTTDSANSTITEISTSGQVLLEAGLRIGTDGHRVELGSVSLLAARTLGNGAGSHLWLRKLGPGSDLEIGSATVQNSGSVLDNAVSATGQTILANGVATALKGLSTTANNGNITVTTRGGDLTVTQNVMAHGDGYVDIRTANAGNLGDVAINNGATVGSTSGAVQIIAGNAITTDSSNGTTTEISTSGSLLLEAGLGVGSDLKRIETGLVGKLAARTLGNGLENSLWLRKLGNTSDLELGTVAVQNSANFLDNAVLALGAATVFGGRAVELKGLSTTANNSGITLTTQGGDVTITQHVMAHGRGTVDIRTANSGHLGDIAINNGATVSSADGLVQMIAGNTLTTDSLSGTTTEIATGGQVLLEAGLSLGSDSNRIELGNNVKLAARTLSNGTGSDLWLRKLSRTGDLEIGMVTVQNPTNVLDNAISATGQVTVSGGVATELKGLSTIANNGMITLTTQGGDLTITQGITAHGSGAVDLRTASVGNWGDIVIDNGATIQSGTGIVQMIAGNTITTRSANGTSTEISTSGNVLLEAGGRIGTDSNRLELGNASLLAARTLAVGTNNALWLRKLGSTSNVELGAVTVQNSSNTLDNSVANFGQVVLSADKVVQLKGLSTTANDSHVTLTTEGGDLTITQNVMAHGSGTVDLRTANAGNLGDMAINNGATVGSILGTVQLLAGNTITTDSANGTAAEIATLGDVLLEAGGNIGSDGNRLELGNTPKVAARTLSNGSDGSVWLRKLGGTSHLDVGHVILQNSASTLDQSLSAQGQTTIFAGRATALQGISTTANHGSITLTTQGGDLLITRNITAHGSGWVDIRTHGAGHGGDMIIDHSATVGSTTGTVQMVAGKALTALSLTGTATEIATGGDVLLFADSSIGSDLHRIEMRGVTRLAAESAGPVWLLQSAGDLRLSQVSPQNGASTLDHAIGTISGLKTTDSTMGLTLAAGDLTLDRGLNAGSGDVMLNVAGSQTLGAEIIGQTVTLLAGNAINQGGIGKLQTTSLRVAAGGLATLDGMDNAIGTIAGIAGSDFTVINNNSLVVGSVTTTHGADAVGTSLGLASTTGNLLFTVSGSLRQTTGAGVLTAANKGLGMTTSGPVVLEDANDVGLLAANVTGIEQGLSFNDVGDYALDTVGDRSGVTTQNGSVVLTSTQGSITESGTASVSGSTLKLVAGQSARLVNGNHVSTLAAETGSDLSYYDTGSTQIGSVEGITGVSAGGKVWVRTAGDLTVNDAVTGQGDGNEAVVLAATQAFWNKAGINAVKTPNGRWLVYDDNPALDQERLGGLTRTFTRLHTWYDDYLPGDVTEAGNGYITTAIVPDPEQYARQAGGSTSATATGNNSSNAVSLASVGNGTAGLQTPAVQLPSAPAVRPAFEIGASITPGLNNVPLVLPVKSDARFVADLTSLVPKGNIVSIGTTSGEPLPSWLSVDPESMSVSGTAPAGSAPISLRLTVNVPGQDAPQTIDVTVQPAQENAQEDALNREA